MHQRGLTLIEMVATLTILAILLHLAMPSFRDLIDSHRGQVAAQELVSAMRTARTEAILRHQPVIIQPLKGDWGHGWQMVADASGKGLGDSQNPVLLVRQNDGKVKILGDSRLAGWVRFTSLGTPSYAGGAPGNGSLYICDQRRGVTQLRIVLATAGRAHVAKGPGDNERCASTNGLDT